ncbi:ComGG family competence protein [Sporolactobacillus sp. CPB3-1]|uniref:ComGG family competence protein n=1 Tax=Sporolactobacillus mangiferae TaxID=2940498 RepID=A0ABT0M696_9BACL|nr:competence type IV pilus minor pilin ComGG [Sporolactobacillus mangiferae]MCL1630378.1 ComGG family competence protein [Sporolactobacillus mangiferae]
MNNRLRNQNGFILPLSVILSVLLLAFILHSIIQLNSDRKYYHYASLQFTFQQLRECALIDLQRKINQDILNQEGSFNYRQGTVSYHVEESTDSLIVTLTISARESNEVDKVTFSKESKKMTNWLERIK